MKLYVNYEESRSGGEIRAGQENDEWPSYEPTYTEFDVVSVTTSPKSLYHEEFDVLGEAKDWRGKSVYVVVAIYTTGSTFGSSHGNGHIEDVYDDPEEARRVVRAMKDGTAYPPEDLKTITLEQGYKYKPWEGYFEALEDAYAKKFIIDDEGIIR